MDKRRWKWIYCENRFPIEVMHGYESYSAQSQYNLLACWLMCVAYLYADNSIKESPSPSDIGGYVLVMKDVFHKVLLILVETMLSMSSVEILVIMQQDSSGYI